MVLMLFPAAAFSFPTSASTPAHRSLHDRESNEFRAHRTHRIRRCGAVRQSAKRDINSNAEQGRLRDKFDTFAARMLMENPHNQWLLKAFCAIFFETTTNVKEAKRKKKENIIIIKETLQSCI